MDIPAAIKLVEGFLAALYVDDRSNEYNFEQFASNYNPEADARGRGERGLYAMRAIAHAFGSQYQTMFENREGASDGHLVRLWASEARQLQGALADAASVAEIVGPSGPAANASMFHSWVWHAAVDLWDVGQHQQAVLAAAEAVNRQLRAKIDRSDVSGAPAYAEAFSMKAGKDGVTRLRSSVITDMDSDEARNAHVGAMEYGKGCATLIRNLAAHLDSATWSANFGITDDVEQLALEQLAALSVISRVIDSYNVVAVTDQNGSSS